MSKWIRAFLKDTGSLIQIPGWMCIPSFIVIAIFEEWFALIPFALLAVISIGAGQILYWSNKKFEKTKPGSSYALVSLVWLIIPLLATIPFIGVALAAPEPNSQLQIFKSFHSSFFEAMSGFTSTGLSMLDDSSIIPKSLQWWRSICEWVGGLGIIFIAVAVLDTSHGNDNLYQSEAMDWTISEADTRQTVVKIWWIYLGYTALGIIAFWTGGMPFWEALNHGLTGIATGGFSVTKDSFISYSENIKWIAIFVMMIGSFSFKIHFIYLIQRDFKRLLKQTQLFYLLGFYIFIIGLLLIVHYNAPIVDVVFQVSSALGTCGFNSIDLSIWDTTVLFPLIMAMFLGGNTSSTTGGIKTKRIVWLIKAVKYNIQQAKMPEVDKEKALFYYNKELVQKDEAQKQIYLAAILLFLWVFTLAIGSYITSMYLHDQYDFYKILFDVNSALNNVGLSSGVTGDDLPLGVKYTLITVMWVGRLEIVGVIVLFSFILNGKKAE